jgi:hypothetical protein
MIGELLLHVDDPRLDVRGLGFEFATVDEDVELFQQSAFDERVLVTIVEPVVPHDGSQRNRLANDLTSIYITTKHDETQCYTIHNDAS